jgi:hypothetical protein
VADDSAAQLVRWVTNPFLTSGLNRAGSDRVERPSHP